ncbi:uncharacterized protein LOC130693389 [Daphnia carinata]|uniref:uncharacterized protein LOC130693389 n=1 Tax=Daphnia carinata TaxID=120202 RepID=UPI00257A28E9|nr:uncharacterized protein LOC130693389 [Daphnia carinata]
MSAFLNVTLIGVLMLVIQVTESFDWNREQYFQDGLNTYLNGYKQSTGHQLRQKRTTVTTTVDGKFTVQLIVSVDPITGQVSLPDSINGGRFRNVPNLNARRCQGRQCNYSLSYQKANSPETPAFADLKRINKSQSRTTADEKAIQDNKRVTVAPRYTRPKQVINRTSTIRTTVRYPLPTSSRQQMVNRTRIVYGEWARRTSARKPSVLTTTARNALNSREGSLLLTPRNNSESAEHIDNVFHQKKNETESYGESPSRSNDSIANYSNENGKVIQSSQFNESIFRDSEKPITVQSDDIVNHTTSPKSIIGHSGADNLNLERSHGPNMDPNKMEANQTTEGLIESGSPTQMPVHCKEPDCLPWERRAHFEVQIHPQTKEIVNIRVPLLKTKSKPVRPSHEYGDSRNIEPSLSPSNSSGKDEEFPWQNTDGFEVEINPKTQQVVNISAHLNATNETTVRPPHVEHENSSAEKLVTPALEQTTTKHEELPWLQRGNHQVQIDPKTEQVVNIRTKIQTKSNLTLHENPITPTQEIRAPRTKMVIREALMPLPIPFYYRKQIMSQSSNPDPITYNLTKESETVIQGRIETMKDPSSTTQPPQQPTELPWQLKDGFEIQIHPTTKEVVNVRIAQNSRYAHATMHAEQATVPDSVTQPTTGPTLVFEPSQDSDMRPRQHQDDDIVQTKKNETEDIQTQLSPTPITLDVQTSSQNETAKEEHSSPTPDLNSQINLLARELANATGPVIDSRVTTTLVPVAELSEEDFPWQQRDDYEVQIDPKTKQVINIRLQTTTTHNPISKPTQFDEANDPDRVPSQTRDRAVDTSKFIELDDEHGDIPRRKDVGKHEDDQLPDEPRSRIAVLAIPNGKDEAIRKTANNRSRTTKIRKPILSHSDGLLYFRYADDDDLWEQLEPFNRDSKFVFIDEHSWIGSRPGRGRDSPYFYFSDSSSVLMTLSCYPMLLVACLVFLIS